MNINADKKMNIIPMINSLLDNDVLFFNFMDKMIESNVLSFCRDAMIMNLNFQFLQKNICINFRITLLQKQFLKLFL